ncbi:unnamed protein product [Rotaria socialis]
MFKNNKLDDYLGIYPTTREYQLWMLNPYDKNGKEILFQGIRYCTDDDACQCRRFSDYLRHIGEFWKYITGLCLLAGENGIEILSKFNNGLFDKPFVYHRRLHIPCRNIPHPKRNKEIIKYCRQEYKMLHETLKN